MVKKQSFFGRVFGRRLAEEEGTMLTSNALMQRPEPHQIAFGTTGTQSFAGYTYEEYLAKLRGRKRSDVFDEMRRSDPQIQMCLAAVKNPIKQAVYEVEPADGEIANKEVHKDFINQVLFKDCDFSWTQFIEEALTIVDFGHSVFEITHKVVNGHPVFGDFNGIKRLGYRSPRTIETWNLDSDTGDLKSITQNSYGDLNRQVEIPAQFLMVMSINREGSNFEGISLLRPVYGCWFRKNQYMKLNAIGIEKFAVPTPIATVPVGKHGTPEYDMLIAALEAYSQHESNYLLKPAGWEIELNTNTYDPQKVEVSIDNEDKRIAKAFLANFLELGSSGGGGSYALSNDLSDFFLSGLEHLANTILNAVNAKLIPDLVKMKYGPQPAYPKMCVSGISDKVGKELAEIFKMLGDGKWLTPSNPDEDYIRKRYRLPQRSLDGVRDTSPKPQGALFEEGSVRNRIRLALEKRDRSK